MCPATPSWPTSKHDFTLYLLVAFAPDLLLRRFLRRKGLKPKGSTNPLVYAAYFNKDPHARVLLSRGAKLNRRGLEVEGFANDLSLPIEVALQTQHYDMVTLFLTEGSTVSPRIFRGLFSDNGTLFPSIPASTRMQLLRSDDLVEGVAVPPVPDVLASLLGHWGATEEETIATIRRFVQVFDNYPPRYPPDVLVGLDYWSNQATLLTKIRILAEDEGNVRVQNSNGNTLLHNVLHHFRDDDALKVAKPLVSHGCDPLKANSVGKTPLHLAVERNCIKVVQYFLTVAITSPSDIFATLDPWGGWKTARMIRLLVNNGANPLVRTEDGDSVLHIVLRSFYNDEHALEAVKFLVDHGCNPLESDSRGKTPLDIAVQCGPASVAEYLLSRGAFLPPDVLLLALDSRRRKLPMIEFLVAQGANVHARASNGDTVLHVAARVAFNQDYDDAFKVFEFLVECGCDPAISNIRGETPLQIASEYGHPKIADLPSKLNGSIRFLSPPEVLEALPLTKRVKYS